MTPEEALALSKTIADIYSDATTRILTLISRTTAKGIDTPRWAEERLAELVILRRNAQKIVSDMQAASSGEVVRILNEAYKGGRLSGLSKPGLSGTNTRSVEALAQETNRMLTGSHTRVLRATEDIYRRVIAETVSAATTGTITRREAAANALDRFAAAGITGFRDSAGRNWTMESYAEMATRTALGQAHVAGTIDRIQEQGGDLVIVSNSPEECRLCRPFEGKILSLSGADAPDLPDGFVFMGSYADARSRGLHHPNCTHRIDRYVPGLTKPMENTENPQGDEDRQRQRALERAVRESKRRVEALRPLGETAELRRQRALLKTRQTRMNDFNTTHDRKKHVSAQRTQIDKRFPGPTPTPRAAPVLPPPPPAPVSFLEPIPKIDPTLLTNMERRGVDPAEWNRRATNPEYGTKTGTAGALSDPYAINCQRVVQAYELRRRGLDVTARPNPGDGSDLSSVYAGWLTGAPERMAAGARWQVTAATKRLVAQQDPDLAAKMVTNVETYVRGVVESWPVGARGWIRFGRDSGAGHIFNVERTVDGVKAIEAQVPNGGERATLAGYMAQVRTTKRRNGRLALANGGDLSVLRVDDLDFNEGVMEAITWTGR